jgi:glycosyltransferase involved in cell wall biosynthesis
VLKVDLLTKTGSHQISRSASETILNEVTVLILTYNEAPNIARTLEKLRWARRVVVVDSFSTDETLTIISSLPNVCVIQRCFDSFAQQCNFGLTLIDSPWVLSLDADYVLSDELLEELANLRTDDSTKGYAARFRYCIHGKPLRSSLYPPRTVLYRRDCARYRSDGHSHRVVVSGETKMLSGWIDHDDRKDLGRWLTEQNRYMGIEANKLLTTPKGQLDLADCIRRWIVPAPLLVLFYALFIKGLILDGWPGWYYVLQRTLAEILLSLKLIEARLRPYERSI